MFDILSKFTTRYQNTLLNAHQAARQTGRSLVEIKDLFYALTLEQGSLANDFLSKQTLTPKVVEQKLYDASLPVAVEPANLAAPLINSLEVKLSALPWDKILLNYLDEAAKKIIERSVVIAWRFNHRYIGTEHLLYALTDNDGEIVKNLWHQLNLTPTLLKQQLLAALKSTSRFPDLTQALLTDDEPSDNKISEETPALDFFCTDLTSREIQSQVDPVIGRDAEIERLINILARRSKNNPLLLGDPGVGKTAIVEGLAKRILEQKVPEFLLGKKIYALDLGLVVAGTMYRGEFENRLKQILDELKIHPEIIIFIDEIHTIIGTGAAPGTLDLANLLKPALAKGFIRCIGATTPEEYKKSIETDAALERRFQVLQIAEPGVDETVKVLQGIRNNYERFHGVTISQEAIEAAVEFSERYLPEKFLPDKAIDLLDEAASKLKISKPTDQVVLQKRAVETKLKQLSQAKELAIKEENFPLAMTYKDETASLINELNELNRVAPPAKTKNPLLVTRQQVAEIVAQITGVAITELIAAERDRLTKLENLLSTRLIGQTEAVAAVAQAIRRSRLGLASPTRPIGSFMFLGPSGVGKTELAKLMAEIVFNDPQSLIRLDMSEFAEAFNVSKLIGAPAGYVGYKDSNKLTDLVKRKPACVVLFDEIEKAHPDIFNLLLQILEDGHLTDAAGKQINFKNTLIIMTSNLGLAELSEQAKLGFTADSKSALENFQTNYEQTKNHLLGEVKKFFRPEFLNRLDNILVFNPLTENDLAKIVELQIADFNARLRTQKINLAVKVTPATAKAMARLTFSPEQGARGLRRLLQNQLEDPLTNELIAGSIKLPAKLTVKVKDQRLTWS